MVERKTIVNNIRGLSHVALDVSDLEASLEFYVGKLGFEEMFRLEARGWLLVNLRISDAQHLELFVPPAGSAAPAHNHAGAHHICLEVDDIAAAIAAFNAKGGELARPRSVGRDHNEQAWISDPDGNRIEFMQMDPNSLHRRARERLAQARAARDPVTAA
jgi:lactoylglutathione lyase